MAFRALELHWSRAESPLLRWRSIGEASPYQTNPPSGMVFMHALVRRLSGSPCVVNLQLRRGIAAQRIRRSPYFVPWVPSASRVFGSRNPGGEEVKGFGWIGMVTALSLASAGVATVVEQQPTLQEGGVPMHRHAISDAVERASPWVVNVLCGMTTGEALGDSNALLSSGSGFIISEDGLVVTNAHVVCEHMDGPVVVTLTNGDRFQGKVCAIDERSDLALVKVEVGDGRRLPVAAIGKSGDLRAGEWVVALGSPRGLTNTCTAGIVSATARQRSELGLNESGDYIQTDAAVNSGNSGGPLIDLDGKVIGINSLKMHGVEGVSFAIPVDTAWQVISQLRSRGRVDRPHLGMRLVTVDNRHATAGRDTHPDGVGVMVLSVTPGSPADRAGLRFGDIVVEFDGEAVKVTGEVLDRIGLEMGREIEVVVQREGEASQRTLKLVTEPGT
ncbi:unnamed protein product [Discosporangium mesarthrocarpum]